jgi:hypothetical protein
MYYLVGILVLMGLPLINHGGHHPMPLAELDLFFLVE